MIDTTPYAVGFVIYVMFNLITFDVYSKGKEYVNHIVLYMIYVYYTLLAGYVINLVDGARGEEPLFIFLQVLAYAIAGGVFMVYHYKYEISKNKQFQDKTGSF
jgi:hypothetical protein